MEISSILKIRIMKKINLKIALKIGTPIILIVLGIFFMSYGNIKNHPSINGFIVKSFMQKAKSKSIIPDFENYTFRLESGLLEGYYIAESGYFNPSQLDNWKGDLFSNIELIGKNTTYSEKKGRMYPAEWIKHGGYSADVPEVPASLRHFYDPTRSKGYRYLTDIINSAPLEIIKYNMDDPETNGVEWALGSKGSFGSSEHNYTWENGKGFIKGALEQANLEQRNKYMAKAWRSLGETLHMIADNGCPAHVRNDAHPSIPYFLLSFFGNPDMYEEDMAIKKNRIDQFNTGNVPKFLKEIFEKDKTVDSIAHHIAVFTNKNFFTTETISGTDWKGNSIKQITHSNNEYSSPKLSPGNYSNNYYRGKIAGFNKEVLLATDTWFFKKYPVIKKTYPFLNEECVNSQAEVLIPAIVDAGVNVMKLFIPKLKIVISEVKEDGTITGEIIHKTDQEYKKQIYYNGPVEIKRNGITKLASFQAKNGKFSGQLEVEEKIFANAEIEFGRVFVQSDEFIIKVKKEEKKTEVIKTVVNDLPNNGRWVRYTKKAVNGCDRYESECWPLESCIGGDGSYQITIGSSTCGSGASGYSGSGTYTVPPSTLIPGESYVFKATAEGKGYTSINIYFYKTHENLSIDDTGKTNFSSEWNQRIVKNSNSPATYILPIDLNKKGAILIEAGGSIGNVVTSRYNYYLYKWEE